jgi:hypothetical protein
MSIKPDKDHSMGELVGPIENCGYLDKQLSHRLLFAWGIFNPYGPTWSSLTLATIPDKRLSLIYLKISNPFSIKSYVHGWVQEPAESKTLMPLLLSMFSEPGKGQILKCAPTFIVCCSDYIANLDYIPTLMFRAFTLAGVKGLDEECEIMRKYWLKPWERTQGVGDLLMSFIKQHSLDAPKTDQDLSALMESFVKFSDEKKDNLSPLTQKSFLSWFSLVTDPDHVMEECKQMCVAWQGAIDQVGKQLPSTTVEEGLIFHWNLLIAERTDEGPIDSPSAIGGSKTTSGTLGEPELGQAQRYFKPILIKSKISSEIPDEIEQESGSNEPYDDLGPEVIQFIYDSMRIDAEWSINSSRGLMWWGHHLAQRIWADQCQRDMQIDVTLMHVETDFLKNVEDNQQTYESLNALNKDAIQFAFIYDPRERWVKLHTSVYTHRQNIEWSRRLFLRAVGLQVSYAHMKVESISHLFKGSEPDISNHPDKSYRQEKDEMVSLIEQFYIPMGENAPPLDSRTFKYTEDQLRSSMMVTSGENWLTAEFPFSGNEPVSVRLAQGKPGIVTSLFMANSKEMHPLLGRGLMMRMKLPVSYAREEGLHIASILNLKEATEWSKCHLNGAWCIDDQFDLAFISFFPIVACQHGELANFALSNSIRSKWAWQVLTKKEEDS